MDGPKRFNCSLCGHESFGYGNNPEPLAQFEERCCDDCNSAYVIPARMLIIAAENPEQRAAASRKVAELAVKLRAN
jgi:hypothetical protein